MYQRQGNIRCSVKTLYSGNQVSLAQKFLKRHTTAIKILALNEGDSIKQSLSYPSNF